MSSGYYFLLVLLIEFIHYGAANIQFSHSSEIIYDVDVCVSYLVTPYVSSEKVIYVMKEINNISTVTFMHSIKQATQMAPLVIFTVSENDKDLQSNIEDNGIVLLYVSSPDDFIQILWNPKMHSIWNTRARFVVIFTSLVTEGLFTEISDQYYKINILRVTFLASAVNTIEIESKKPLCILTSDNPFLKIFSQYVSSASNSVNGNAGDKVISAWKQMFPNTLKNLYGYGLKTTGFNTLPKFQKRCDLQGNIIYNGYAGKMIEAMGKSLNFTLRHAKSYSGPNYGKKLSNGTWIGMLGDLVRREVDIGALPLIITTDRLNEVDISGAAVVSSMIIMVRKSPALPVWMSILLPFEVETWLSVLGIMTITVIFILILQRIVKTQMFSMHSDIFPKFFWNWESTYPLEMH